jgi:hypothetical protein
MTINLRRSISLRHTYLIPIHVSLTLHHKVCAIVECVDTRRASLIRYGYQRCALLLPVVLENAKLAVCCLRRGRGAGHGGRLVGGWNGRGVRDGAVDSVDRDLPVDGGGGGAIDCAVEEREVGHWSGSGNPFAAVDGDPVICESVLRGSN